MYIKTYSYRYAEEILMSEKFCEVYKRIIHICRLCPIPYYPNKSNTQKNKDVIQQLMNTYFYICLKNDGWIDEAFATPESNEDSLRADFRKKFKKDDISIQIEVEFGNVASVYRDYVKFQLSFSSNLADLCILIVPSYHLCKRIDSGLTNFEKICRELPSTKLSITVPILVIGLFDVTDNNLTCDVWNVKEIESDLNVCKGAKNKYKDKHYNLILRYIESINDFNKL